MQFLNLSARLPAAATLLRTATIILLMVCALPGQERPKTASPPTNMTKPLKPKLTAQQEHGLRLLKAAQAEAPGLQPDMRAFALLLIADGYEKVRPAQVDSLLGTAFRASQSIEKQANDSEGGCPAMPSCDVKGLLQVQILGKIADRTPERVAPLLNQAEPEVRKNITEQLIGYYTHRHEFERAKQLLDSLADEDDFPFSNAMELIKALPQDRAADRLAIFTQALTNFQQHLTHASPYWGDFGGMVVELWQQFPPSLVLNAIDSILEKAQEKDDPLFNMRIGVMGSKGNATFSSTYEYRLFELLPILEELDKAKAESLLRDDNNLRALHGQYPGGFQSVDGSDSRNGLGETRSMFYAADRDSEQAASAQARFQMESEIDRRLRQITSEASTNAKQALSDALSLPQEGAWGPESCPRLLALQEVAANVLDRDPAVARSALDEERKLWEVLPDAAAGEMLIDAAETYHKLGDDDNAQKTLKLALKVAERAYARDTSADDPNQAFKGSWPSTDLWRRILAVAGHLSEGLPAQLLAEIPDPDIATLEKVTYGDSLLSVNPYYDVVEIHKDGGLSQASQ